VAENSLSQTTYVRGLAIEASTGRIFAGAVDELGYFENSADGERKYVSLLDRCLRTAATFATSGAFTQRRAASTSSRNSR
jgi:hypothetical protein